MKLVYQRPDGVTVITPAPQNQVARVLPVQDLTPSQYIQFIKDRDGPKYLESEGMPLSTPIVEVNDFPSHAGEMENVLTDLTVSKSPYKDQIKCFRGAWELNGNSVVENPAKVKELKSERCRRIRDKMLEKTDYEEFSKTGQELADVRTWRQSLRDLGSQIDTDPDNVAWPTR